MPKTERDTDLNIKTVPMYLLQMNTWTIHQYFKE